MSDKIKLKMAHVQGDTTLDEIKLVAVCRDKYKSVSLCIEVNMNIPIADIKLYDSERFVDAAACFEDAQKLGIAIAGAWNERKDTATARLKTAIAEAVKQFDAVMKEPASRDRGQKLARILGDLEDSARATK